MMDGKTAHFVSKYKGTQGEITHNNHFNLRLYYLFIRRWILITCNGMDGWGYLIQHKYTIHTTTSKIKTIRFNRQHHKTTAQTLDYYC